MRKKKIRNHVVMLEAAGFGVFLLFLWTDEVFDLPHYLFGAQATPINWIESLFESFLATVLAILAISFTCHCIKHIKYLEGFLLVCAGCKKVCHDSKWVPMDVYVREHTEAEISHGLCPDCAKRYFGGLDGMQVEPSP